MKQVLASRASFLALFGSVCLVAGTPAHAITFQTFNNPGDPNFNQLLGINNSGKIAGYFGDGTVVPNSGYTFTLPSAVYTPENFPNSVQTQVTGLNNTGTTVGFYVDGAGDNFGFYKQGAGPFVPVINPGTGPSPAVNQLLGVNDSKLAAGFYVNGAGNAQGYLYNITSGTFTPVNLPSAFNAVAVTATGVNNADDVSGFYTDGGGFTHGFLEVGGAFYSLNDPNGANTLIFGLNNKDQAVGSYTDINGVTQGFLYNWSNNSWLTISDPFASATAAFGVTGTTINGLNDKDQLVGFFSDGTNVNGFMTVVPEPSSWAMMLMGFAGLGFAGYRRNRVTAIAA